MKHSPAPPHPKLCYLASILHLIPRKCKISGLWWVFWISSQQNAKQLLKQVYTTCLEQQFASSLLEEVDLVFCKSRVLHAGVCGPHTLPPTSPSPQRLSKGTRQGSRHKEISGPSIPIWIISPGSYAFGGGGATWRGLCILRNEEKAEPTPGIWAGWSQGKREDPQGALWGTAQVEGEDEIQKLRLCLPKDSRPLKGTSSLGAELTVTGKRISRKHFHWCWLLA